MLTITVPRATILLHRRRNHIMGALGAGAPLFSEIYHMPNQTY